jgi:hypothetical protein
VEDQDVKTTADFLDDLRARFGFNSDNKLALHLGMKRAQLGRYRRRRRQGWPAGCWKLALQRLSALCRPLTIALALVALPGCASIGPILAVNVLALTGATVYCFPHPQSRCASKK